MTQKIQFKNFYTQVINILIEILVEKKILDAFLHVIFLPNFSIKIVEVILKISCFANRTNMLRWQ